MAGSNSEKYEIIYIVGHNNLFHDALSFVFEQEVCEKCIIIDDSTGTVPADNPDETSRSLFLIDCFDLNYEAELLALSPVLSRPQNRLSAALFNLQKETGIEKSAFNKGARGFFYRTDSLSLILKGLRTILRGEVWVSRELLVEYALRGNTGNMHKSQENTLTQREMQILALVSMGVSNDEIAEKLFLSSHTVKTHLYNIFKKIKVPNRLQAALWAAKNLQ